MLSPTKATLKPGRLFIGGDWKDPVSGRTFESVNPATGKVLTKLAEGGAPDVDEAVQAARRALVDGDWPKMAGGDRAKLLWKLGETVLKNREELAELETLDQGKPIFESSKIEVPFIAEIFFYYSGWASKIHGETNPLRGGSLGYTLREPVGVCGLITPWNFPLLLACWKIAPALAAGCTIVHKPAQWTSLTALRFAELAREAGLPPGVLNIVTGKGSIAGAALASHPGVDKIAFTGSTETGREIMKSAAVTTKKVTLELGGKSPNIVFADADLPGAARGATAGIFYNKGEVCAAGSRLFVEASCHDALMEQLLARSAKWPLGDPLDPKTRVGPIVAEPQLEKVMSYVEAGKSEGARLVLGGKRARIDEGAGCFLEPTVFTDVDNTMTIAREEIFGPVLSVIRFEEFDEVLRKSNDTFYGLAAGVWTRDIKKAHRAAHALQAGTVWINTYNLFDPAVPFGGYKQSGFGRELGREGLDGYLQTKAVWVDLS
jgi:acyl-CoA reductase-like NAD-dependent aldehyde dehydrogenase